MKKIEKLRVAKHLIACSKLESVTNKDHCIEIANDLIKECEVKSDKYLFVYNECNEKDKIKFMCWMIGDRPTKTEPASIYFSDMAVGTSEYGDYDYDHVSGMVSELTEALGYR